MVQIIYCKQCGESLIKFGDVSVNVNLSKSAKACEHCNNVHTEIQSYHFCNLKCFNKFIKSNKIVWSDPQITKWIEPS